MAQLTDHDLFMFDPATIMDTTNTLLDLADKLIEADELLDGHRIRRYALGMSSLAIKVTDAPLAWVGENDRGRLVPASLARHINTEEAAR